MAALTGLSRDEVVARHQAGAVAVAFTGFAPGFGYLVGDDRRLHVPRREDPRTKVPAARSAWPASSRGVYPRSSPGGWQLIGRTDAKLWDPDREPPALLAPATGSASSRRAREARTGGASSRVRCTRSRTSAGRAGLARGAGRPARSTPAALRLANRLVGNAEGAAGLEITLGQASLRGARVAGARGHRRPGAGDAWTARARLPTSRSGCPTGALVELGAPTAGCAATWPCAAGWRASRCWARSAPTCSPGWAAPLAEGDELPVGPDPERPVPGVDQAPSRTPTDGVIELRVVPGPRADWFTERGRRALLETAWTVDQRSNRVGLRLDGPRAGAQGRRRAAQRGHGRRRAPGAAGNGLPVLFLADHPVTGGYPVIAVVVDRGPRPGRPGHARAADPLARGLGSRPVREGGPMTRRRCPPPRSDARWPRRRPASCSAPGCGPRRPAGAPAGRRPT